MKLSCIIPSFKDPLLFKTIESLLSASELGDQLEIIAVFDGYWPTVPVIEDPRVRYLHLGKNRGMREAINAGVSIARGEFIMRSDEHCTFGKGFDRIMVEHCQPDQIMTAIRYFLNPEKWEVMEEKPFIYEKLRIREMDGAYKFEGQRWPTRDKERENIMVDETMAMQGSCWVMSKDWWDKVIQKLDSERYGNMYQDQHEMIFKTWRAGGKMMLNKHTWFAHKHYSFSRTHRYGSQSDDPKIGQLLSDWKDYYLQEICPKWNLPTE